MLDPTLVLLVLFAVAIGALATTRISAAQQPGEAESGTAMAWRATLVGLAGASAASFSLAPELFLLLGADEPRVLATASVANAAALVAFNVFIFIRQKRLFGTPHPSGRRAAIVFYLVTASSLLAAVMGSIDGVFRQPIVGYVLSLASWFYVALLGSLRTIQILVASKR